MGPLGAALLVTAFFPVSATVSGVVTGTGGQPVPGARVFLEAGLGAPLSQIQTGEDGAFQFANVPSGIAGVFAIAEGYGFGGLSQNVPVDDAVSGLAIALRTSGGIAGKVVDMKGEPVSGARITGLLLLGESPVGIPLAKLKEFGFDEPVTDGDGRFAASMLPQGTTVALKVGHANFAQAGVQNVTVGDRDVRVQLSPGVLVQGTVLSRDGDTAVANAAIIIRSATPPHDTVVTKTGFSGDFAIRLNPGYYLYQASGLELRSPGWEKLTVSGREPGLRVTLRVAGIARLTGDVRDAVTGAPVAGARLALVAYGSPVDVVTTGSTGTFQFAGAEGENIVRLEAVPGYAPPDRPYLTLQAGQGEALTLPTFWLRPLPAHRLQIVDEKDQPANGVLVRLIRPFQYGIYISNAEGWVQFEVASFPEGGRIVGLAEQRDRSLAALFSIEAAGPESGKIKLFPVGAVSGTVVNDKGKPIQGAIVGGLFQRDEDEETLKLWRTVSDKDGKFTWNAVVPFVPMACLAAAGTDGFGRSMPFNVEPGKAQDVGNIVIAGAGTRNRKGQGQTVRGENLDWSAYPILSGSLPASETKRPTVILFTTAAEAPLYLQTLTSARSVLRENEVNLVLVSDGPVSLNGGSIPILQGTAPGSAPTYLLDANGVVALETWDLPPLAAIAKAGSGA